MTDNIKQSHAGTLRHQLMRATANEWIDSSTTEKRLQQVSEMFTFDLYRFKVGQCVCVKVSLLVGQSMKSSIKLSQLF